MFRLFDFDNSADFNFAELMLVFSSCIYGVSKITHTPCPSFDEIKTLTIKGWEIIDDDKNGIITFQEFWDWVETDEELQEFYIFHLNYQTKEHAINKYSALIDDLMKCFAKTIVGNNEFKEPLNLINISKNGDSLEKIVCTADTEALYNSIIKSFVLDRLNKENMDLVSGLILKYPKKIKLCDFFYLMRVVCAFIATDIDNDNVINPTEFRCLLWLINGSEPSEGRMEHELATIDANKDYTIQLSEWLNYLASADPVTGVQYFDYKLRRVFDKFDTDHSGTISINELTSIMMSTCETNLNQLPEDKRKTVVDLITNLTKEMMASIDRDKNANLDWFEFKNAIQSLNRGEEKVKQFFEAIKD